MRRVLACPKVIKKCGPTYRRRKKLRRMLMMLGMEMLIVMLAAGVVLAVNKQCGNNLPC